MNFKEILNHPLTIAAAAGLGVLLAGILGAVLKGAFDLWTNEVTRRQDSRKHVANQIEEAAPTYHLMSNYAYLLSFFLNDFIERKRQYQVTPMTSGSSLEHEEEYLLNAAQETSKKTLFYVCKLYRAMMDHFWIRSSPRFSVISSKLNPHSTAP